MITGSHGKSMFSFVRNHQTAFQSECSILRSTNNEWRLLILHIFASILFSMFHILAILRCVVNSHCWLDFRSPDDTWWGASFYMLWAIYMSSLVRHLFMSLSHILTGLSNSWVLMFWISVFIRCVLCKYFLPVCGLSSHCLDIVFLRAESFIFIEVKLINYFFY